MRCRWKGYTWLSLKRSRDNLLQSWFAWIWPKRKAHKHQIQIQLNIFVPSTVYTNLNVFVVQTRMMRWRSEEFSVFAHIERISVKLSIRNRCSIISVFWLQCSHCTSNIPDCREFQSSSHYPLLKISTNPNPIDKLQERELVNFHLS